MRTLSASLLLTIAIVLVSSLVVGKAFASSSQFEIIRNGPPAPASLMIHDTLFDKITAAIVPIVNQIASNITIPGSSSDHVDIDPVHIVDFNLGPITFTFTSPNTVQVALTNLAFQIPDTGFKLKDKILFVHVSCSGKAYGQIAIGATFSFNLIDANGKIALDGATAVNIDYKTLNIGYKMDDFACKIVSKFINFVIGGITDKIKAAIEKDLGPGIQKALTTALNNAFTRLPVGVTGNPTVANGVLSVPIDLDSLIHAERQPPALHTARFIRSFGDNTRDIEIVVPQASANTVLQTVTSDGRFHFNHSTKKLTTAVFKSIIPEAYAMCPDCVLEIAVDINRIAPTLSFANNNMSLSATNVTMGFFAVQSGDSLLPLFVLNLNAGFSIGQFSVSTNATYETIKFQLAVEKLQLSVMASNVGSITDITIINWLLNFVSVEVINIFNADFSGIPIPAGAATGFTLTDIIIAIAGGSVTAGFDVVIG